MSGTRSRPFWRAALGPGIICAFVSSFATGFLSASLAQLSTVIVIFARGFFSWTAGTTSSTSESSCSIISSFIIFISGTGAAFRLTSF